MSNSGYSGDSLCWPLKEKHNIKCCRDEDAQVDEWLETGCEMSIYMKRKVEVLGLTYVKRGRDRPKKTWFENIRNDLSLLDLNENLTFNRAQWRKRIHVADPT
ncbi:hypothetical protein M5K25_021893 [Dendrobium thyrsiflorum]|uniref:Uncharacterized protein n=1 Tax=Dendrobium thyrsiflorum TaxID=117978 RepID=A0ABD0U5F3_DENTH